jgi:hypothetical protein
MAYDLGRNVLFSVPLIPPDAQGGYSISGPVISGDRLAWAIKLGDYQTGKQRVYTAQIVSPAR